jgi:hypothetical protein
MEQPNHTKSPPGMFGIDILSEDRENQASFVGLHEMKDERYNTLFIPETTSARLKQIALMTGENTGVSLKFYQESEARQFLRRLLIIASAEQGDFT